MAVELSAHGATTTRPGVALIVDRPLGTPRRAWLRQHLDDRAGARVIDVAGHGGELDLADLGELLGTAPRPFACGAAQAVRAVDDGATLLVVLDDDEGEAAAWARTRARGPVLLLPPGDDGATGRPAGPRAVVVARAPDELPRLLPWARLLSPEVAVSLVGVINPAADTPRRVLADLAELEGALEAACGALRSEGRCASAATAVDGPAIERDATLVVSVERRGLLRRLLPGLGRPARRGPRARLLVPG